MPLNMDGPLSDLAAWTAGDHCSIARALSVVGTRSTMLILREAFYGTTRFDDFSRRVGITDASSAARLKELVDAGIFVKQPYRPDKGRTRYEYVLTTMGEDLLPVVLGLMQWGDEYLQDDDGPLNVVDTQGKSVHVRITDDSGSEVPMNELRVRIAQHEAVREFDA
ncbi:transcriptional regulator [Rhodococcus sp. 05-340-1]|uniref:winged helix-turn-helix transcriptional regulator n=1 Tax=unclassified Rhodococcus (in: high G+C Gram-positive bacteria) TaxID=192944 RepID=UPI000B9A8ABC|nr:MULTISPECIES: helix-turn-helix domain-containing protein [unclassified Rhodococcus (in: high G+C Gram-positive bacteria)]OZD62122.1 transcriptional regulator [Rhodococcus sp. 05-340-2]OZD78419.1 transcriptional regulator [Rhodococcus sp. 05-340-1]